MANWIIIRDTNDQRRKSFARGLESVISPVEGLVVGAAAGDGWDAVWAASGNAPVDAHVDDSGGAIVWGTALDESGELQSAPMIRAAWRKGSVAQWDGYYSAAAIDETSRSLIVGADVLGIFPVYYWSGNDGVVIVGSSPELFRRHPLFTASINADALVGILLTHGLVGDRALLDNVHRLGQGCRLHLRDDKLIEEQVFKIPEVEDDNMPFVAHVDRLFETLSDAVRRHTAADSSYGMLLSGGLDSRMIVGLMNRRGISPRALTLGLPGDLEMHCAKAVARQYGLDHVTDEPDASNYPEACQRMAKWEHLANGFTNVRDWWTQGRLAKLGDRIVTGLLADSLVGGSSVEWAYSEDTLDMSYETFVKQMPKLGVPAEILRKLLRAEEQVLRIDAIEQQLRDEFAGYGKKVPYCAWRYDLAHGQRYHVGGIAWRMSFGAWPVIPMLDRRVIEMTAGLPGASMADRALQSAMIVEQLPELATLPLDRSDRYFDDPEYLAPEAVQLVATSLRRLSRPVRDLGRRLRSGENRYWFRINDFSGTQWLNARRVADTNRQYIEQYFDPRFLKEVLPAPEAAALSTGPYVGESARKMLLGFMYWAPGYPGASLRN